MFCLFCMDARWSSKSNNKNISAFYYGLLLLWKGVIGSILDYLFFPLGHEQKSYQEFQAAHDRLLHPRKRRWMQKIPKVERIFVFPKNDFLGSSGYLFGCNHCKSLEFGMSWIGPSSNPQRVVCSTFWGFFIAPLLLSIWHLKIQEQKPLKNYIKHQSQSHWIVQKEKIIFSTKPPFLFFGGFIWNFLWKISDSSA